jgi:hypothetical protein
MPADARVLANVRCVSTDGHAGQHCVWQAHRGVVNFYAVDVEARTMKLAAHADFRGRGVPTEDEAVAVYALLELTRTR